MKTKRNDCCPCGSGKKYKKCCFQKQKSNNNKVDKVKVDNIDRWVIRLLKKNINLKLGEKVLYPAITYFVVLLVALREGTTVEHESNDLKQNGKDVPSADRILGNIKRNITIEELQSAFKSITAEMLKIAKKHGKFGRWVLIAIDLHDTAYYGKNRDDPYVVGGKAKAGTNWFYRIATVSIVVFGVRFKIASMPITKDDNKKLDEVVEYLIKEVRKNFKIRYVLLDRGFYSVKVVRKLKRLRAKYIMCARSCKGIREKSKKHGKKNFSTTWTLGGEIDVRLVSIYDKDAKKRLYYITNRDWKPLRIHEAYDGRWGIETGYRVVEEKDLWTTCKSIVVRYLYKIIAIVVYNMWVLKNLMLGIIIKEYKSGKKTIYKMTHISVVREFASVIKEIAGISSSDHG